MALLLRCLQAREKAVIEFKFAEEETLQKMEEEKKEKAKAKENSTNN